MKHLWENHLYQNHLCHWSWLVTSMCIPRPALLGFVINSLCDLGQMPLQSSWASLVAQLVKNLPTMRLRRSPGEGKGYPFQYSGLENSMDIPWSHKESDTTERLSPSIRKIQEKFFWKSIRSQNRVQQSRKTQI